MCSVEPAVYLAIDFVCEEKQDGVLQHRTGYSYTLTTMHNGGCKLEISYNRPGQFYAAGPGTHFIEDRAALQAASL